jgi:membrane protein implicated in regulation of membrane protease activity
MLSRVRTRSRQKRKLLIESVAFGLGYAATLIWIGSAFVGSFGDFDDAYPYWPAIHGLRTDTAGAIAFAVAVVTLVPSRYLQLRRRAAGPRAAAPAAVTAEGSAGTAAVLAVADVAAVLGTGVVIYLSVNAAMHPWTLPIQLTHLLPWPTEGTVRVVALVVCLAAMAARRYLRSVETPGGERPAPEQPAAGQAADGHARADVARDRDRAATTGRAAPWS